MFQNKNMRFYLLSFIISFCHSIVYGQTENVMYAIVPADTISQLGIVDGKEFIQRAIPSNLPYKVKKKVRNKLLYLNRALIDSTGLAFIDFRYTGGQLLARSNYRSLHFLSEKQIKPMDLQIANAARVEVDLNQYYILKGSSIYQLKENDLTEHLIVNLDQTLCVNPPCHGLDNIESIEGIFQIDKNSLLIHTCITSDVGPSCEYVQYYLFDAALNKTTNQSDKIKSLSPEECKNYEFSRIHLKSSDNKFLRWYRISTSSECNVVMKKSWITDSKLNHLGDVLDMGKMISVSSLSPPLITGMSVTNDQIDYIYLLSKSDDGQFFHVPYQLNYHLESGMFKIYKDTLLSKDDLNGSGKYELGILRNLIFAKHNYDFDSDFYKAYFNLYCFYNTEEMRSSRTKDVNNKLTDNDKKNLNLIKSLEGK